MFVGLLLLTLTLGNSSAKSTVKTSVEGEGSVYNRIEVQVNDQKQVLESNQPGEYSLQVSSSSSSQLASSPLRFSASIPIKAPFITRLINFFEHLFSRFVKIGS